jgi:rhamnosyltransferase
MRTIRSISVLVPTFQGIEFLGRLLDALARQSCARSWELVVVDSSSTDGSWELLSAQREAFPVPFRLDRIHPVEFDHGDTRNLLASRSTGDLLVFLTQDAIPLADDWLERVACNFEDEGVAAVTCRNVVRPDASAATHLLFRDDPCYSDQRRETRLPAAEVYAAMEPEERRGLYVFNDVASAIRRELWERHPFPRTQFGEDMLMARALLEAGYCVVYDAEAAVEHSHGHDERESYRRGWIDGRFSAEWLDRVCIASFEDQVRVEGELEEDDACWIDRALPGSAARSHLAEEARLSCA